MNHPTLRPLHAAACCLLMAATAAFAASAPATTPDAKPVAATSKPAGNAAQRAHQLFRDEMALCTSGQSVQGRRVCEQEARAAHAQNLRGALADGAAGARPLYSQNAQLRCQPLPAAERGVCLMRAEGKAAPDQVLVVPGSEAPLQATTPPRP